MKKWILYYIISFLVLGLFNVVCFIFFTFLLDSFGIVVMSLLENAISVIIVLIQLIIFIVLISSQQIRMRFMIAFTAIASLFGIVIYGIITHLLVSENELTRLTNREATPDFQLPVHDPYLGVHLIHLLPVVLQVIIFLILHARSKKLLEINA